MENLKRYLLIGFNVVNASVDRSPSNQGTELVLTLERINSDRHGITLEVGVNVLKCGEITTKPEEFMFTKPCGRSYAHSIQLLNSFLALKETA